VIIPKITVKLVFHIIEFFGIECSNDGTLRELGLLKDGISQREAHRIFGGGIVQSLLNRGLIHRTIGKGVRSKIIYPRKEIEKALQLQGINLLPNRFC
jgi:hypothetical protein